MTDKFKETKNIDIISKFGYLKRWLQHSYPDSLRIIRLLYHEAELMAVTLKSIFSLRQWRIRQQLKSSSNLKIQLGGGQNSVSGWIDIDSGDNADIQMDIRRSWPLNSESVTYIFTEHFLDHLQFPYGIETVLKECYRVLKPGGIMRVIVHDAELLLRAYLDKDKVFFRSINGYDENTQSFMTAVNHIFRFNDFHQFIYDYETLEKLFLKIGFSSIKRSSFRGSQIAELNLDLDIADRAPQSLYIEAIK